MRTKKYWVYDYETILNCFIAVFEDLLSSERKVFVISPFQNDLDSLISFYKENIQNGDWHLGYNNLAFDSQITEFLLDGYDNLKECNSQQITKAIYNFAQSTIRKADNKEFLDYPEFKLRIKNIDIYTLNYWNSNVKRSSLKWIQYTMDWENVEEMPHDFRQPITSIEAHNTVIEYCINDVKSTKQIYNHKDKKGEKVMISQINLRSQFSTSFDLNLYSAAEPKIAKDIFLQFLSKKLGIDKRELKDQRTYREFIEVKDVILPYVNFKNQKLKEVKEWFETIVLNTDVLTTNEDEQKSKGPKKRIELQGSTIDFSLGGIHGICKPGIYITENGKTIKTCDVDNLAS